MKERVQSVNQRGSLFVETAILVPFLMFSSLAALEVGRAITQYLNISRVAYEGARYAATVPGLSPGPSQSVDCNTVHPTCDVQMMLVRRRIHTLLQRLGYGAGTYQLATTVRPNHPGTPQNYLTVEIDIRAVFMTSIRLSSTLAPPLRTVITAPYLFPD